MNQAKELLNALTEIQQRGLATTEYQEITSLINSKKNAVLNAIIPLKPGTWVIRSRPYEELYIPSTADALSYRKDVEAINKFGRVNRPQQSMFYGSLTKAKRDMGQIVNLSETNELIRNSEKTGKSHFYMATGIWTLKKELPVSIIAYSELYKENNDLHFQREHFTRTIKTDYPEDWEDRIKLMHLFGDQFAKPDIADHSEYKISAAFNDLVDEQGVAGGILYPSVRTRYEGMNIALYPDVVDEYFEMVGASYHEVYIRNDHVVIDNLAYSLQPKGDKNYIFDWQMAQHSSDEEIEYLFKKQKQMDG